jgi:hypothetical protein
MILRIFDQYIPVRKIAFFFLESVFIGGMVILGAYVRFLGHPAGFYHYEHLILKALLIVACVKPFEAISNWASVFSNLLGCRLFY